MSAPWIAAFVALWILVGAIALLVFGTLRRLIPLIEDTEARIASALREIRTGGLSIGTIVPDFVAATVAGGTFSSADLRDARSIVMFVGAKCPACTGLIEAMAGGYIPTVAASVYVVTDDAEQARVFARSVGVPVILDGEKRLSSVFQSDRTPHAFVTDAHARVLATGSPNDWSEVQKLIDSATEGGEFEERLHPAAALST